MGNKKGAIVGTGIATGTGAAAFYGISKLSQKVKFFQDNWWAPAAALLAGGGVLAIVGASKGKPVIGAMGQGLAGAAGALGTFAYITRPQTTAPAAQMTPAAPQVTAMGYSDAGVLVEPPQWRRLLAAPRARQASGYGDAGMVVEEASGLYA